MHLRVLRDATGTGGSLGVIVAIYYAASNGADVVNMSLSSYFTSSGWVFNPSDPSRSVFVGASAIAAHVKAWKRATDYAHERGATLVASAANNAIDRDHMADLIHLPGDLPHVIQVSATGPVGWLSDPDTDLDVPAPYTDYGQSVIDLAAPGGTAPYPSLSNTQGSRSTRGALPPGQYPMPSTTGAPPSATGRPSVFPAASTFSTRWTLACWIHRGQQSVRS